MENARNFLARQKANIQRDRDSRTGLSLWFSVLGAIILALSVALVSAESPLEGGWILDFGWMVGLGLAALCTGAAGLVPEGRHRLIVSLRIAALGLLVAAFVSFIGFQATDQALEAWFAPAPYSVWVYAVVVSFCVLSGFLSLLLGYGGSRDSSKSTVPEEGMASETALRRNQARASRVGRPPRRSPHPGDAHPGDAHPPRH